MQKSLLKTIALSLSLGTMGLKTLDRLKAKGASSEIKVIDAENG